ncbi:MAG: hypothetical protein E6356_07790 [Terrisporobacter othiniensis]|uniref:Uncharacterized protein n=1 Tax=Terrisporobacter petrolearius TaxID=1460447 RepID=A0ABZ3FCJ3_9FIRM|nr:hypothetical protein [Terrisporobacter petrolearius]MDU4861106.1 hypothetical protein [Terrisporobacter othiniensis]MDU6994740.1 hypothetical protein [Terrisporobacter othiniensis]
MEFHYYYIIQDIIGILMAFIGIRMLALSIRMILSKKDAKNIIVLSVSYVLIAASGINLLLYNFEIKTWIRSIAFVILSLLITKIVNIREK